MTEPGRAYDKDGKPFTQGTIGQIIAENGIHHVTAYCETPGCGHDAKICVDT